MIWQWGHYLGIPGDQVDPCPGQKMVKFVLESLHFFCLVWLHLFHEGVYSRIHHAEGLGCDLEQSKALLPDTIEVLLHQVGKTWVRQRAHLCSLRYTDVACLPLRIFSVLGCLQIIVKISSGGLWETERISLVPCLPTANNLYDTMWLHAL